MVKDKIQPTVIVEEVVVEDSKSNKATRVIQLRTDNPNMTNVNVADEVGCSQTYSSKIWSDHMKSKGKTTKTRRTTKDAPAASNKPQKITAKRKATTSNGLADAATILKARHDMACIVSRVGPSAAETLLSDIVTT